MKIVAFELHRQGSETGICEACHNVTQLRPYGPDCAEYCIDCSRRDGIQVLADRVAAYIEGMIAGSIRDTRYKLSILEADDMSEELATPEQIGQLIREAAAESGPNVVAAKHELLESSFGTRTFPHLRSKGKYGSD